MLLQLKCIKCKYILTEPLPEAIFRQVKNPENLTHESRLEIIKNFIKNVKCPECLSSVYWTGLGDKSFNMEIDVTSQRIVQFVKAAVDIVEKGQSENVSEEYMDCAAEIVTELIERPGQLICIVDPDLIRKAETAINIIWSNVDEEELFNEFYFGKVVDNVHHESRASMIAGDYLDRAKKLRPFLVSVKPNDEISAYFENAVECWLFGINSASLILCCAAMEGLMVDRLSNINRTLACKEDGKTRGLFELIDNAARSGILDDSTKQMAHGIRELRRESVHRLRNVDNTEAFNAIMNTKKIIEKLLT